MDRDLKAFRDVLLWLWDSHTKPWSYSDQALAIYSVIAQGYASIRNSEELERFLPAETKVRAEFPKNQYLYLNPIRDDTILVPVLSIASDFGRSIPVLGIRLGLFLQDDEGTKAYGYRFEAPEGPGKHHYYHAQFIHGFEKGQPFLGNGSWLPTGCPTFPLDADNPVKLLLSLLISLYGLQFISQIKASSIAGIDKYLEEMCCPKFGTLYWCWLVGPEGDGEKKIALSASENPEKFSKDFLNLHPKWKYQGITRRMYDLHPRRQQWQGKQLRR